MLLLALGCVFMNMMENHLPGAGGCVKYYSPVPFLPFYDAAAFLVVSIPDSKPRTIRVNITLPEMTLKQIDAAAKKRGMSRSSFLVHAAQSAIQSNSSGVSAYNSSTDRPGSGARLSASV